MSFSVEFEDQFGNVIRPPSEVEIQPEFFDWAAVGGPKNADLGARGRREALTTLLGWLSYRVMIRNRYGQPCWWGFVGEVLVGLGAYSLGVSLETMYNRVAVAYTYTNVNNELQRGTTQWHESQGSVVTHGYKELLHSHADLESESAADDLAQSLLARFSEPISFIRAGSSEEGTATLRCWGWWTRTGWRYYKQAQGREAHESFFATQALGVAWTGSNVSFLEDNNTVYPQVGEHGFQPGNKITVTGSRYNNGIKTIASSTPKKRISHTSNTIFFAPSNDIYERELGHFDEFEVGDLIQVGGADNAINNGIFTIDEMDLPDTFNGETVDHIELETDRIVHEDNGFAITINRNGHFRTEERLRDESPSPGNVTIMAWGQKIAQRFQLSEDAGSWNLHEVRIRVRKVGNPTDGVKVSVQSEAGGSASGTPLDFTSLLHGALGTEAGWEGFTYSGILALHYGVSYWLVVERTGPPDADNYYEIGVDDNAGYVPLGDAPPKGNFQLHTGTAWEAPPEPRSLAFQLIGKRDTGVQLQEMIKSAQPFTVVDTISTLVMHPVFRDGDSLIIDEVEPLLTRGDSAGVRLIVEVHPDRRVRVSIRPSKGDEIYSLRGDGTVLDAHGEPLPPGVPLAGKWVRLNEPGLIDLPADKLTFFVEEASYDVATGRWTPHPQDAPDPFNFGPQQG